MTCLFPTKRTSQAGFGLFELLVIVGVSAITLVTVAQLVQERQRHNQTQHTARLLEMIVDEAVAYQRIHSNYDELNCNSVDQNCYFVQKNILPSQAKTSFGGDLMIASPNIGQNFALSFQNIPQFACPILLKKLNDNQRLAKVELFNPDQVSVTSSEPVLGPDGQPIGVCPPQSTEEGQQASSTTEMRYGDAGTTTNDIRVPDGSGVCISNGGFNVLSMISFPMTSVDMTTACSNFERMTMVWTFN